MSSAAVSARRPSQTRTLQARAARRSPERTFSIVCGTVLVLFALIWLVPFAWSLVTSLRPEAEISTNPTAWWSNHWTLDAYRKVITSTDIGWWYVNSILIAGLAAVFTVVVCSMIGFALAHTRFRGRSPIAGLILIGLMIPTQVLILPQFLEFKAINLLGTYWAIILPAIAAPVAVFIFRAFMAGIPDALIEAARIDGAGWWLIYARIIMPLCRPAISAVFIFTFVTTWNNLLWPPAGPQQHQADDHPGRAGPPCRAASASATPR